MRMLRHLSLIAALLLAGPALAQLPPGGALIVNQTQIQGGSAGQCLFINSATTPNTVGAQACAAGAGTVTSVSVVTANGVSGSVATATTTPAITLTLGAITPTTVNGNTITTGTGTLTLGSVTLNAGAGGTLGSNAFTSTAYAPLASPAFTGAPTAPTAAPGTNTTQLATTAYADAIAALKANLASPTFTGTVTIPTLAATTINAFTLAGTISGGGNQINNVIIGTTTPLAGSFTTLSASTSVTSPLHYGGSAAGSTATLSGTSNGSPSSAFLLLQSGTTQFVGVNNASPKTTLDINVNTASSPALVVATSLQRVQAADTVSGGMEWVSYGTGSGGGNILSGAVAAGTSAAPTATPSGRNMFNLSGFAWTGSAWAKGAIITMATSSLWSGTNQASQLDFYTTATGSTTVTLAASFLPSGGLIVGAGAGDPGAGKINALNGYFVNNIAGVTRTCTIAVGNVLTFTLGILTATSGVAGCV